MACGSAIEKGKEVEKMKRVAALLVMMAASLVLAPLHRIEASPSAPVIVAFWGLETDFGANIGDGPTLTSLATLAYDCRRPDMFRKELLAALDRMDGWPEVQQQPLHNQHHRNIHI